MVGCMSHDMPGDLEAQTITIKGHGGDEIEAYLAEPRGGGPYGGVVVIHHMPGYDRSTKAITRRFAAMGYVALMPNLYHREAPGAAPDDAAATAAVSRCARASATSPSSIASANPRSGN